MVDIQLLDLLQVGGPTAAVGFLAYQLVQLKNIVLRATDSIESLNIKMAVVVNTVSTHELHFERGERRMDEMDGRLRRVEAVK